MVERVETTLRRAQGLLCHVKTISADYLVQRLKNDLLFYAPHDRRGANPISRFVLAKVLKPALDLYLLKQMAIIYYLALMGFGAE